MVDIGVIIELIVRLLLAGLLVITPPVAPTPKPKPVVVDRVVRGVATWYDDGPGIYGAAGPALRHGDWRGRVVQVCSNGKCLKVRLTDWCACGKRNGQSTLIDLSSGAFARLAPLSRGVIRVTVKEIHRAP